MKPQGLSGTHSEGLSLYIKIMRQIKLTNGQIAQVDNEDYEKASAFNWTARKGRHTTYASRHVWIGGKRTTQTLHQFIMGGNLQKLYVDHRDGDGLNNQKYNLRFCTIAQNAMNQRTQDNRSSKYRGVGFNKPRGRYQARIQFNKKSISLGYFTDQSIAAKAYDIAANKYFGEFARLNFPL